ncbi:unnamed protein product [Rotaria sp. Silwood2]|nr:unnamed protein product [Rotaria sp. Silwood2]CAF3118017.1 unnamed protein product [Rotaria sp. Silwood2]CAF4439044.1 unnamed protein product [Rotaria sp. Silwood2]
MQAPYTLHEVLNRKSRLKPYSMVLSAGVGRSTSKEQYIFFNRESASGVKLINSYLYQDTEDRFERPPFIGTFQVTKKQGISGVKYFIIINVHLRPTSAYQEFLDIRYVIEDFILKNAKYFSET